MGWTPSIAVVTRPTRLQGLRARWGTLGQAKFRLQHAQLHERETATKQKGKAAASTAGAGGLSVADFDEYEHEDKIYAEAVRQVLRAIDFGCPVTRVDRDFVPNYDFMLSSCVVVIGQDGLVANVAKYVGDTPIVAINPDPSRFDGVLLPFEVADARSAVQSVMDRRHRAREITLAEARLNDGQRLLAFNDLFIGRHGHASARYTLDVGGAQEAQSSSGVLVSTGAGSTGWLSSVFNMAAGIARLSGATPPESIRLPWEDRRLLWAVREPFASRQSATNLVAGLLPEGRHLTFESLMPDGGVIFSDGVEADFLPFNTGSIAHISASAQAAKLVVP